LNERRFAVASSLQPNIPPALAVAALDLMGAGGLCTAIEQGGTLEAEKEGCFGTSEEAEEEGCLGKATVISKAKTKR